MYIWCDCQYEQSEVLYESINSIVTNNNLRNSIDHVRIAIYKGSRLVTKACCFS